MLAQVVVQIVLALAASAGGPHPNSQSSSRIVVTERTLELELVCQTLSLIECVPIDTDRDLRLDAAELERGRAEAQRYLEERYRVSAPGGGGIDLEGLAFEIVEGESELSEQRLRTLW